MIGISIGAQPILGFNYGAKNYKRVQQTYLRSITIATVVAVLSWLLFMLVPDAIIKSFGDNSPEFVEFGALAFRSFLGGVFLAGFQIVSSNYFQATGHPGRATFLAMTRQIIILIPLMLLMGYFIGLNGVLYSGMSADILSSIITLIFIIIEMRRLGRLMRGPGPLPC
jgi:Na+-driven multidrug efflux pump